MKPKKETAGDKVAPESTLRFETLNDAEFREAITDLSTQAEKAKVAWDNAKDKSLACKKAYDDINNEMHALIKDQKRPLLNQS